ncbi:peptidoglycan-binding domain-containing protein [Agromyces humi]|uniref:peptidoglycan-binding domain-containing protein n=1 Tax=Agromyces humi TaxID=1766800 RepID=UPI00135BF060|nr:peptidoglycan-binding protein [Agromyces humi]
MVFAPPRDVLTETPFTFVELVDGEVGSSMSLNTVGEWASVPAGTNQAAGTVTAIRVDPGTEVDAGTVLYEVNLRPVVAAAGATPSFRALARGAKGADVQQLQSFLAQLGFYDGKQDGEFGAATHTAVRKWQDSLGVEDDGVVQAGDLLFIPTLPGRVALDTETVYRGASLTGGEEVLSGLSPEPTFTIPATTEQAMSIIAGTEVRITAGTGVWVAQVSGQKPSTENTDQVDITLTGVDGGSICGADCGTVPPTGESIWPSEIVTQAVVTGVLSPSAALLSDPDGHVTVVDNKGRSHDVTVIASARGMSIIEGAEPGLKVRVPAAADAKQ